MRNQEKLLKQLQRLTVGLMISGALNVVLVFLILYLALNPPKLQFDRPVEVVEIPATYERTNGELLRQFRMLPFEALTQKLDEKTLIENGYSVRDLALASLVNFHAFDLERALGRVPEERSLVIGKRQNGSYLTVKVFPGLSETDFEKIDVFVRTEKWPQNANGLFSALKKQAPSYDSSLKEAFMMTSEYRWMGKLMQGGIGVSSDELLQLVLDSDWKTVAEMAQKKESSASLRQQFLIRLIEKKSKAGALVFLKTDSNYVAYRLDDGHLIMLLGLLDSENPHASLLQKRVLASPRSNAVLAAAKRLSAGAKPEISLKEPEKASKEYIVQEGDNLWKISRRFNIDIERIKKQNQLQTDTLKPGTSLKL